jgi:hypothetical protein
MTDPQKPWPPLIVVARAPAWVRWRDFVLTLMMWTVFAIMLETEFELFFGHYLEWLGLGDFDATGNWGVFFRRLGPYIAMIIILVALLVLFGLFTVRRRRRSLLMPQPAPLAAATEARRVGMAEAELTAARGLRNVVVHIDPDGRHRVEPRKPQAG